MEMNVDNKNRTVYLLWHTHTLENTDQDDDKLPGVYSTKEYAEGKIKTKYRKLPGFTDNEGEFAIDQYVIDEDQWNEDFISVK